MKKKSVILCIILATFCATTCAFFGCGGKINYLSYVSEKRTDIFVYEDDNVSVKIYCTLKEQPYAADGICSEVNAVTEIFVTLPKTYDEVEVSCEGIDGEMNYQAVESRYYLSFSAEAFKKDSVDITLTYGGGSKTYSALSVRYAGVMTCDEAVKCVIEHDRQLFESLTENGLFNGEIYVRLLFDEGCYYYVGVIDKSGNVTAYLIDGERGIVIATKQLQK